MIQITIFWTSGDGNGMTEYLVNIDPGKGFCGKPRTDALKNLAKRTGVDELTSLVSMLVQTDKFGTSLAKSLRVFSDSMRTKRRQKAEEAAAKTTIKMVFPLALCIMPALFVVILGPGALHIFEVLIKGQ